MKINACSASIRMNSSQQVSSTVVFVVTNTYTECEFNEGNRFVARIPTKRYFGSNVEGKSVCINMRNHFPYFLCRPHKSPPLACVTQEFDSDLISLINVIARRSVSAKYPPGSLRDYLTTEVPPITEITLVETLRTLRQAEQTVDHGEHFKVVCGSSLYVPVVSGIMRNGVFCPSKYGKQKLSWYNTFEDFTDRGKFIKMREKPTVISLLIESPAVAYEQKETSCHMEHNIYDAKSYTISTPTCGLRSYVDKLRILSFDVEVVSPDEFPTQGKYPVVTIGNMLSTWVAGGPLVQRTVFCLYETACIGPGVHLQSFKNECDLLSAWRDYVVMTDPDVLTGFNILGFDLPYLLHRAQDLMSSTFAYLGRLSARRTRAPCYSMWNSNWTEFQHVDIPGRLILDTLKLSLHHFPSFPSHKLRYMCEKLLNTTKLDIAIKDIPMLASGTPETRRKLAEYCLRDAELAYSLLMEKTLKRNSKSMLTAALLE